MKRIFVLLMTLTLIFSLTACEKSEAVQNNSLEATKPKISTTTQAPENKEKESNAESGVQTPITLTIGDIVLDAYLNDSAPAQNLVVQLPLTVTLNDSGNDFCGDNLNIQYSNENITSGYENGDLAFWPPASNFVIFVSGEENSASTDNLVKLGHITSPQEMLDALEGQIEVTIALQEDIAANDEANTDENIAAESADEMQTDTEGVESMRIRITVGDTEMYATLEDNATTRALLEQMPMTLSMQDLYGREMCYRYGADTLPTDILRSDGYEVGDIAYWPPSGSLVILYAQNGEQFERQHLGHIDSGVEVFKTTGDVDVTFDVIKN